MQKQFGIVFFFLSIMLMGSLSHAGKLTDSLKRDVTKNSAIQPGSPFLTKTINVNMYASSPYSNSEWNNWNLGSGLTSPAFNYSDGSSSTITSTLSSQAGVGNNGANYPTTMCPPEVGREASWHTSNRSNTLNGLDPAKLYDIKIYSSRTNADQSTRFTINGQSIDINTVNNYSNAAVFTDLSPSAGGSIVISIIRLNAWNYINGFTIVEKSTANQSPVANGGGNKTIQLPTSSVTLTGSGTDADGTIASYAWTQLSGTTATIASPSSATTNITGLSTAGVRVFRLTVTDNEGATGTNDVTVTVNAANQSPVANGGGNKTIQLPTSSVTLTGSGTDADGTIASYAWTQLSGTTATIASPSSATTNITGLSTTGARVFRLTVTDNQGATGTNDVTVTVNAANQSPVANGGGNKTIQLPTSSVTLTGSGTDADGTIASYAWTQLSGTTATIASPSSATTNITGLSTTGARVFRLTVTDNQGATGNNDVTVTVNAAAAPTVSAGTDQTITLPTSQVTLTGTASANNGGSISSYAWTLQSGTGGTITSPASATTTVTGLTAGSRTYLLTVTDNTGGTNSASVVITVLADGNEAWKTTGNAATTPSLNFIGTTDEQPLVVKTNNSEVMRINTNKNVSFQSGNNSNPATFSSDYYYGTWVNVNSNSSYNATGTGIRLTINNSNKTQIFHNDNAFSYGSSFDALSGNAEILSRQGDVYLSTNNFRTNSLILKNTTGYVGIGTINPTSQLHTTGTVRFGGLTTDNAQTKVLVTDANGNVFNRDISTMSSSSYWTASGNDIFNQNTGNIGIGTNPQSAYKLAVNGVIGARKVKVTAETWADFVFDADYKLPTLKEVEAFIQKHKHLPDVPSAKEIDANGIDLGKNQAVLLQKIEELTLYMIEQNKKIEAQGSLIVELKEELKTLQSKLKP